MAITVSGLYVANFVDVLDATQLAIDLSLATHKWALYNNTKTPNYSSDTTYSATNEVSGTGWAAGGVALSTISAGGTSATPTLTESPAGSMKYDMNDISVATTTLSLARGMMLYADALAGKNSIVLVNFGADYSTVAGTFAVVFDTLGVFALDLTP